MRSWQPGEYLPQSSPDSAPNFHNLLGEMQMKVINEIKKIEVSVSALSDRVKMLEDTVSKIHTTNGSMTPTSSDGGKTPTSSGSRRRHRHIPTALSVITLFCYYIVLIRISLIVRTWFTLCTRICLRINS